MRIELDISHSEEELTMILKVIEGRLEDYLDWVHQRHECRESCGKDCSDHSYPYGYEECLEKTCDLISQIIMAFKDLNDEQSDCLWDST